MAIRIFYAWQSDRSSRTHKQFIRDVLDDVVKQLVEGSEVEEAERPEVEVDQDTQGEVGLVNVFASIQRKIIGSDVFVCDLTHVCEYTHPDGRKKRAQNGNVLIELGFAMRNIDHRRIICVMNKRHGGGSGLPFDLNLYRHPVGYDLGQQASDDDVLLERSRLATDMKAAVEASIRAVASDRAAEAVVVVQDRIAEGRVRAATIRQQLKAQVAEAQLPGLTMAGPYITMSFVPLIGGQSIRLEDVHTASEHLRPLGPDVGTLFHDVDSIGTKVTSDNRGIAVTRLFEDGHATGAAVIPLREYRGRQVLAYYWVETRLVEVVSGLIAMSKAAGIIGPWEVAATLVNASGKKFTSDTEDFNYGPTAGFESNQIEPKPVTIAADIGEQDLLAVASAIRPILDGFWRAHGFRTCWRFKQNGEFKMYG